MPFGVNSDPSFQAQKQRIRVRVSSFRTAGTVFLNIFHIYIYIYRSEVYGSLSGLSDPRNQEIGFVSSSFSFRACRACGRGEAAWAHVVSLGPSWS